jgi:hypothetical protein
MKRPLVSGFLLSVFLTGQTLARPGPTPTPGPGPELDIVFTGVVVFKEATSSGYDIIMPRSQHHTAYIRFPTSAYDKNASNFPVSNPFSCGGVQARYAILTRDELTIQPSSAIEGSGVDPGKALDSLPHLRPLVPPNTKPDPECNKPGKKVAAQFDLRNGTLEPALEPETDPTLWEFKKTPSDPAVQTVCSGSGILAKIRIKAGQGRNVSLVSTQAAQKLALILKDREITTINIGNSRTGDISCPPGRIATDSDPDFKFHYQIFKDIPGDYIPYKKSACSFKAPADVVIMSLRGSNCIGSQWP